MITLADSFGYEGYKLIDWEAETVIDARKGVWLSSTYCTEQTTCKQMAQNSYPFSSVPTGSTPFPIVSICTTNGCVPNRRHHAERRGTRAGCGLRPGHAGQIEGNVVVDMAGCAEETPGFRILRGEEGQAFWDAAVRGWLEGHPKVARISTDPDYHAWRALQLHEPR